jgi:hypothetical protein
MDGGREARSRVYCSRVNAYDIWLPVGAGRSPAGCWRRGGCPTLCCRRRVSSEELCGVPQRKSRQGGLGLTKLAYEPANPDNFATWVKIHDRVSAGEMPPAGMPRPVAASQKQFVEGWRQR